MTGDPFRTASQACPTCGRAPLREFLRRRVCDGCGGMLISLADLTASIAELAGPIEVELSNDEPVARACPLCDGPMTACRIEIVDLMPLDGTPMRCASHGLWLDDGWLEKTFVDVGHRAPKTLAPRHAEAAGYVGAKRRRPPTAPPPAAAATSSGHASAFDGLRLSCPVCNAMTDLSLQVGRWSCRGCDGLFVEYRTLEAMVQEITHQPWHVPVAEGRTGARACPVCSASMLVETIEQVTIDRCPSHGMWFDREELASMLEATLARSTTAGWLKRLFT